MRTSSIGHMLTALLSPLLFSCIVYAQASAYGGQPALDVTALRRVRPLSPDSLYLIVPVSIGGCSKCIAENLGRYQRILDCVPKRLAGRTVLLQLVKVGRMIEFTSLRSTYPDIEGMTPDVRSIISGATFNGAKSPVGVLLLGNEQIALHDEARMCETVRAFGERYR